MRILALFLLLSPLAAQDGAPQGLAIERTVRRVTIDSLDRREEIHRKELVLVRGRDLAIVDLTYGDRLILRPEQRKIWKVDPLAREYSELGFDQVAALRKSALDQIQSAKARVPGTADEKKLEALLEGFDRFAAEPRVELKASGAQREVIVNGDRVRLSVQVDDQHPAPAWLDALAAVGAFHPAVAEKLKELGGVPVKGTMRYVLFLDRVVEQFENSVVTSRAIPDSEFEIPKGLVRVPLRNFEPAAPRKLRTPPALKRDFKEDEPEKPKPEEPKKDKP